MLYGRQAANAAAASTDPGAKMDKVVKEEGIPDLAPEFFDSAFFRRFQIQSGFSILSGEGHLFI